MLDPKWLRLAPDEVRSILKDRNATPDFEKWLDLDRQLRERTVEVEKLQAYRNTVSKEIGRLKASKAEAGPQLEEMQELASRLRHQEENIRDLEQARDLVGLEFPNRLHPDVPRGQDETANLEIRRWGEPTQFNFTPQPHWDLGQNLGILDFSRAAKIAGARFAVLLGAGALLERALGQFMLDIHVKEHGYREVSPPLLHNRKCLTGTGQLPKFASDLFRLADIDYFMTPTAEVPLANLFAGEILAEEKLPVKLAALTPCFRAEAGAAGKDTRGILRQHQFNKVELVKLCTAARAAAELESLTAEAEKILRLLKLPYRVIELCSGDIGFSACRTYDLEVWVPSQNRYREVSSCSDCGDFQARRMQLRYRAGKNKPQLLNTLNGSGLALGRTWLAVLENYQDAEGNIIIPECLVPYCSGRTKICADEVI